MASTNNFLVFPGESTESKILANNICKFLGIEPSVCDIKRFKDGETQPQYGESVSGKICIIVTCMRKNPGEQSMILFQMCDALRTSHAGGILIVSPYTPYARQDKPDDGRSCVTSGLFARLLDKACGKLPVRYMTLDLHAGQLWTVFNTADVLCDNLHSEPHMIAFVKEYLVKIKKIEAELLQVVAPDGGAAKRAKRVAGDNGGLNTGFSLMDKTRKCAGVVDSVELIGGIKGKHAIIPDDMIDTGGTICAAARKLKQEGALTVTVMICHGVFSNDAIERLNAEDAIDMVVFTNTCYDSAYKLNDATVIGEHDDVIFSQLSYFPKFYMIDITWLLAQAVKCRLTRGSVSKLFELKCTSEKNMIVKTTKADAVLLPQKSGSDLNKLLF